MALPLRSSQAEQWQHQACSPGQHLLVGLYARRRGLSFVPFGRWWWRRLSVLRMLLIAVVVTVRVCVPLRAGIVLHTQSVLAAMQPC